MLGYAMQVFQQQFALLAIAGAGIVVYASISKTKWGVNLRPSKGQSEFSRMLSHVTHRKITLSLQTP
jgi:hypothetical protein